MGKHESYHELRDALAQGGCALCHLAQRAVQRFLDHLLYENVNDPGLREDIRQARGFCNLHAWQLRDQRGALGIAILHRDVLETVLWHIRQARIPSPRQITLLRMRATRSNTLASPALTALVRQLSPQQPCPACRVRDETTALYIHHLLEHVDDPAIESGFRHSGGLCLPHLRQSLQQASQSTSAEKLLALQREAWEQLLGELNEFIRKQDYRFLQEGFGPEGDAWIRVVAGISGQRGGW